ncbi:hypothetical protein [Flavobacterium sp.]|uniref:hypothetical protein n=1 Tax=Flavobacterium sp. TaxID=239 RepID=UPI00261629D6|nr:hypothetical protein [Flavobacterium sp.]
MKLSPFIFCFFFAFTAASSQQLTLKISGKTGRENKVIDSISYKKAHPDLKSLKTEMTVFHENMMRAGYIECEIGSPEKINDTVYRYNTSLGNRTKSIVVYTNAAWRKQIPEFKEDAAEINFNTIEAFLKKTVSFFERQGYALAKVKLVHFEKKGNALYAELIADLGKKRELNDIVIKGYEKFPQGHLLNIKKLYRKKTFNQENLKNIYGDFEKFRFVKQTKYPEILFTKDTTKVYVYLEKATPNKFEGFIGFSNDEKSNVKLNGYLDLQLVNILNSGEEFSLYWKSDGEDQKTFNLGLELPYIFKSKLGLKTYLNIFKQDSTFQNTRTAIDLGYLFNYNTRTYIGYQSSESSDIQNQNNASISDYKNAFITADFEYVDFKSDQFLFPENTRLTVKIGKGSRTSKLENNSQYFINADIMHNFYLDKNNSISLRSQDYYLKSKNYIINELYRFGGINSIRGFNENSLQANLFASILTEYRYQLASNLYAHSIIDYGHFDDSTSGNKGSLLGLGFGFGLLTKNGLLHLIYANGSANHQEIKLSNSIIHISFKTNF